MEPTNEEINEPEAQETQTTEPSAPSADVPSEAQAFYEKFKDKVSVFEQYNATLEAMQNPFAQEILNNPKLAQLLIDQQAQLTLPTAQQTAAQQTAAQPQTLAAIEIPEFSPDDLTDPAINKLASVMKQMKGVIEQQNSFITQKQQEEQQAVERNRIINEQKLRAAQLGMRNVDSFFRFMETQEGLDAQTKMIVQWWNTASQAGPAPTAPPAQSKQPQKEKPTTVPAPGAGAGGGNNSGAPDGFVYQRT